MAHLVTCKDVVKTFGRVHAIDGLSISIDTGAPVGLVGPNGAGKTTLFSLIAGFLSPDRGSVHVNGIAADASQRNGLIGILPQDAPFLRGISVRDQLQLFARLQGMESARAREETHKVTSDFEVADLINRKPEKLSYGQRKRVALAQAIIGQPSLVLLDEPTSGLDPVIADDVRRLIRSRASDMTFVISSHNLAELEDICHTIIVINQGKLIVQSTVAELRGQDQHLGFHLDAGISDDLISETGKIPGVIGVTCVENDRKQIDIEYDCTDPDRLQMDILNLFQRSGLPVVNFRRGKKLSDGVVKLVRGKN